MQASKSSKSKQVKATSAIAQVAATIAAVPAATPQAPVVAKARGAVIASVRNGKPYKLSSGGAANQARMAIVAANVVGDKPVAVAALVAAGLPASHIGYMVRRGTLVSC